MTFKWKPAATASHSHWLALVALALAGSVDAATFVVNSTADSGAGSLRNTITTAFAAANPPHLIMFSLPANSVINLVSALPMGHNEPLTIDGVGSPNLIIDAGGQSSIFLVGNNSPLTLRRLTLRNGEVVGSGGGCLRTGYSTSKLSLDRVIFDGCRSLSNNAAAANGGAIQSWSEVDIRESHFVNNYVQASIGTSSGGALYAISNVTIVDSLFENNESRGSGPAHAGGAIGVSSQPVSITRSEFRGNRSIHTSNASVTYGGAISSRSDTTLTLRNNVFFDNSAYSGSAVYAYALSEGVVMSLLASNNTFAGNSQGAALHMRSANIELKNNTFWKNASNDTDGAHVHFAGADSRIAAVSNNFLATPLGTSPACSGSNLIGTLQGSGNNLFTDASCSFFQGSSQIASGALRIRGLRRTGSGYYDLPVVDLFAGSPAIDGGSATAPGTTAASSCAAEDSRGESRPRDGNADGVARCDVGALELQREASLFAEDFDSVLLR